MSHKETRKRIRERVAKARRKSLAHIDVELRKKLSDVYGPFWGYHHVRFIDPAYPYHVIFKAAHDRALLTPNRKFNRMAAAVIGRALKNNPSVRLYAWAFLNNHVHLCMSGQPHEFVEFIRFLKCELSHRWGPAVKWPQGIWRSGYHATALVTEKAQLDCIEYILSQGVKEKVVERPEQWPGLHFGRQFLSGKVDIGVWTDGTRLAKAKYKQNLKPRSRRTAVDPTPFQTTYEIPLATIPAWGSLAEDVLRREKLAMVERVVEKGRVLRDGKPPLGAEWAIKMRTTRRWQPPKPEWFENRRACILWGSHEDPENAAYLSRYWKHQVEFREAAKKYKDGDDGVAFPPACFTPRRFVHPS